MAVSGPRSSWLTVARSSALNDSVSRDTRGSLAGSSCVAISLLSLFHWRDLPVEKRRLPALPDHREREQRRNCLWMSLLNGGTYRIELTVTSIQVISPARIST